MERFMVVCDRGLCNRGAISKWLFFHNHLYFIMLGEIQNGRCAFLLKHTHLMRIIQGGKHDTYKRVSDTE
ncbi:hypothetical protein DWX10_21900 [Clostridium sp. AF18-27]|nr:hypothetical protein DWX10_21900 [Clostridium sp. AF18-27]